MFFLLLPAKIVSFSPILGKWRPNNAPNVVFHVMENKIIGTMDNKHSVKMEIMEHNRNKIFLDNLQLIRKPQDWFNVFKYQEYLNLFQKIKQNGILCQILFLDENQLEIGSLIGDIRYTIFLEKILDNE